MIEVSVSAVWIRARSNAGDGGVGGTRRSMPKTVTPEALLASSVSLTAATRLNDMSGNGTSGREEANRA